MRRRVLGDGAAAQRGAEPATSGIPEMFRDSGHGDREGVPARPPRGSGVPAMFLEDSDVDLDSVHKCEPRPAKKGVAKAIAKKASLASKAAKSATASAGSSYDTMTADERKALRPNGCPKCAWKRPGCYPSCWRPKKPKSG